MQKLFAVLLILLGSIGQVEAQKVLVLDKIGVKLKRIKYYEGDFIALRVLNDRVIYKGELHALSDSSFMINSNYIAIDSVQSIIKYSKGAKALTYTAFSIAAITTLIMIVDKSIKGELDQVPEQLILPAVFTGIGLIAKPFWKRTYRLGNNRVLKVLDLSPI